MEIADTRNVILHEFSTFRMELWDFLGEEPSSWPSQPEHLWIRQQERIPQSERIIAIVVFQVSS